MNRWRQSAIIVLAAGCLCACDKDKAEKPDPSQTAPVSSNGAKEPTKAEKLTPIWTFEHSPNKRGMGFPPVVKDGVLYGYGQDDLFALDAATGQKKWAFKLTRHPYKDLTVPTVTDHQVFGVGAPAFGHGNNHHLFALDRATGEKQWEFTTKGSVQSRPSLHDGLLYAVADVPYEYEGKQVHGARLLAFNPQTGDEVHRFVAPDPVVADEPGLVVTQSYNAKEYPDHPRRIAAIDIAKGEPVWNVAAKPGEGRRFVVVDGAVYAASSEQGLYKRDLKSGKLLWSFDTKKPSNDVLPVGGERVIVSTRRAMEPTMLFSLDASTGKKQWSAEFEEELRWVILHDGKVIGGQGVGTTVIHVLDAKTGDQIKERTVKTWILEPPTFDGDTMFYSTRDSFAAVKWPL